MIAARQIAFGRGAKRKPYDAEIEYLESTGTQYIETDIVPTIGYTYKMKFRSTGMVQYGYLFGVNWRDDAGVVMFFGLRRLGNQANFQSQGFNIGTVPYEEDIDYDITINGGEAGNLNEFRLSDGRVFSYKTKIKVSPTLPMNLLAVNSNGGVAYQNKARLYSFSVEANGEKIIDFIPVRKGNVGYMYDRVSGQLFGNQGTGEFVLGPDIIDYTAKDYVQDGLIRMLDSIETIGFGEKEYADGTTLVNLATGKTSGAVIGTNVVQEGSLMSVLALLSNIVFKNDSTADIKSAFENNNFTLEFCGKILTNMVGLFDTTGYSYKLCNIRHTSVNSESFDFGCGNALHTVQLSNPADTKTLSLVRNGNTCIAYANGVRVGSFTVSVSVVPSLFGFYLYTSQLFGSYRFFSRALTAEEIAHNYEIDKARFGL